MVGYHASNNQERSQATNVTIRVVPRELSLSSLVFGDGSFLFNASSPEGFCFTQRRKDAKDLLVFSHEVHEGARRSRRFHGFGVGAQIAIVDT